MDMSRHGILLVLVILINASNIESKQKDVQRRLLLSTKELRCPNPPVKANGYYQCSTNLHSLNTVCYLHCGRNYKPDSEISRIKCLDNGSWSSGGHCIKRKCDERPVAKHGTYQCTDHSVGGICNLHCDIGYKPASIPSRIYCLASHRWSTPSQCVERHCGPPPVLINGYYQCSTTSYSLNTVCQLHCESGYKPESNLTKITCLSSEIWSIGGQCIKRKCHEPPVVNHGVYHCTNHSIGAQCHLQCNNGYKPESFHNKIHCQASQRWSSPSHCVERHCAPPPVLVNGYYQCKTTSYSLNTVCQLHCDSGYKPESNLTKIECLDSKTWSKWGQCVKRKCHEPPVVNHGVYHCTNHSIGAQCHLQCNDGYKPESFHNKIHCQASQRWSTPSHCVERKCPLPPFVPHGSYVCTNLSVHAVCHLQCDSGYKSQLHYKKIHCLHSGTWSTPGYCFEIECRPPPTIPHGSYQCNSPVHALNSECHLQCDRGYQPDSGPQRIHCRASKTWSTSGRCIVLTTSPLVKYTTMTTRDLTATTRNVQVLTTSPLPKHTTTLATHHFTTTTSKLPASSISCEVCSGPLCGVVPGNIEACPHGKAYCLNHFEKEADGTTSIMKRCASKDECKKRWWLETSDKSSCVKVDPATVLGVKLSCAYCCTTSECNRKTLPDRQTLFIGH